MTHHRTTPHQPPPPAPLPPSVLSRRAALAGIAAGAGALATGAVAAVPARAAVDAPTDATDATDAAATATAEPDPAPGAMKLFTDPGFNFAALLALGAAGMRASEAGEVLTAVNSVNAAGASEQTFSDTFRSWGEKLAAPPPAGRHGHELPSQTRRLRSLRAAQYFAQSLFYVLGTAKPAEEKAVYLAGLAAWDTFASLCSPAAVRARVPYEGTHLPVWFFRPDGPVEPRPTVILTNGSDGQNVDMWTYGVSAALDRGWNALVYDGPGQGRLLFVEEIPFTTRWEGVVAPLIDWLDRREDVDSARIALTGLSMGGNLVARAAAFEHRLAAVVCMPGCVSPWLAFDKTLRDVVTADKEATNRNWNEQVVPDLSPQLAYTVKKRFGIFSREALREARAGRVFKDLWTPAQRVIGLDVTALVPKIKTPTLVLDYEAEQFYPGQPRQMYDLLRARREYVKLTGATGAQLHCSPMAPQQHCDVVFDWLAEILRR
ncbi:alpha/beta fold hydrolase [Streptomyces sp. NBC_00536]|uniref:alpha/beta hydrolase family protein n=1 Tax=Streptomyces sp. NBC_00536 TaxID=2975769 RepID=UPI002E818573|nr:acyl-CoA thioester hydrolase/BAAT C-terminal domain-containing protein [Streptomyces sp. NBC_00536]WUC82627.1 alpha/beta fold hydrolase [Streptomyces sp. NBC_00536]